MSSTDTWPEWAVEAYEERAAIAEHDGEMSREDAERLAEECVRREMAREGE